MVNQVVAEAYLQKYLDSLGSGSKFSYGLVIGQPTTHNKDYVISLPRTPIEQIPPPDTANRSDTETLIQEIDCVANIDLSYFSNHALSAIRMLPASFFILGAYVVSSENIFDKEEDITKMKLILKEMIRVLQLNELLCTKPDGSDANEQLIVHYTPKSKSLTCRSVDVNSIKWNSGKPVDWKFQDKAVNWQQLETFYSLDEIFPLVRKEHRFNIEENFLKSLDIISKQLKASLIFFEGEPYEESEPLESVIKKRQRAKGKQCILTNIYYPCSESTSEVSIKLVKYQGTVKYSGLVSSRIWCHPRCSIRDVQQYIKNDIIRSLAARIQIHIDATLVASDEDIAEPILINEPPRRVFLSSKNGTGIEYSDYLFRGETKEQSMRQAKEVLDLNVELDDIDVEVETLPDMDDTTTIVTSGIASYSSADTTKAMYLIGIAVAVLVLIVSIFLHYMFN